jgi:transposase
MTATALVAAGDGTTFKNGRECAAWLGVVPRQHPTGGKLLWLGISKRGDEERGSDDGVAPPVCDPRVVLHG